jgi:hypothetical protein
MFRKAVTIGAAAAVLALVPGCGWMKKPAAKEEKSEKELAADRQERLRKACASEATYDRLKELVFDEAARIRNADGRALDPIAAGSIVRMEEPLVKSRDEDLNVTVCTGRFVLELPPGIENAFDGMRRVTADVEYAAQAAADGSGLVYSMDGAEPIIYRLASFGLNGQPLPRIVGDQRYAGAAGAPLPEPILAPPVADVAINRNPAAAPAPNPPPAGRPPAAPPPRAAPQRTPAPAPRPAPKQAAAAPKAAPKPAPKAAPAAPVRTAAAKPSFNCRYAKARSERLVCGSSDLAARDRAMSSLYYSTIAKADPATKSRIRASRDTFLRARNRCSTEACVANAYAARVAEIRRLSGGE